jgi:hypothetical protein
MRDLRFPEAPIFTICRIRLENEMRWYLSAQGPDSAPERAQDKDYYSVVASEANYGEYCTQQPVHLNLTLFPTLMEAAILVALQSYQMFRRTRDGKLWTLPMDTHHR